MKKLALMLFLAQGCAHNQSQGHRHDDLEIKIRRLEALNSSTQFMLDIDSCHIYYLMCRDKNKQNCWKGLEQCVKNEYNKFNQLNKN